MLLTAAGWSKQARHSLSDSDDYSTLSVQRQVLHSFPTLINFLARHSSSFPAVTSSAQCPLALLLSKEEMYDIKMLCHCAKGSEPEPLVLHDKDLTWSGLSARVQPEMTVSLCLIPNTGLILSLLHWSLQQAGHMADIHHRGLCLGAGFPSL